MTEHTALNPARQRAMILADAEGIIKIPPGTAGEIDALFQELTKLEKMGYLTRAQGKAFYRPFILTGKGESMRHQLPQAEECVAA